MQFQREALRKAVHHSRIFCDALGQPAHGKEDDTKPGAFVLGKDKEAGQKQISEI